MSMCYVFKQETLSSCQCIVSLSKSHYLHVDVLCLQARDINSMSMCCVPEQKTFTCQCVVSLSKRHLHVNVLCL